MSQDFRAMNKTCDHHLRSIRCITSEVDFRTLLPRKNLSSFMLSSPINLSRAELKKYNPVTHVWSVVSNDDPVSGWALAQYPVMPDVPELGVTLQAKFNIRQRTVQGIWLLSYQTLAIDCIKCNGSNRISDITLLNDPDNALYVRYEAKLAQDFLKMLLTPIGSDPYYTWMGTSIMDLPGRKFNLHEIQNLIAQQVSNAADALKNMQAQQAKIAEQQMHPREMLDSVASLSVDQSAQDSRVLIIRMELYTVNRTLTTVQFPISV